MYESESGFPESQRYWPTSSDDDAGYYLNSSLSLRHVMKQVSKIRSLIIASEDILVKKALLFSSFSYAESYIKSLIYNAAKDIIEINGAKEYGDLFVESFVSNVQTRRGKASFFKKIYSTRLGNMPYLGLRDELAHDIGSPKVMANQIEIDGQDKKELVDIELILDSLEAYLRQVESKTGITH